MTALRLPAVPVASTKEFYPAKQRLGESACPWGLKGAYRESAQRIESRPDVRLDLGLAVRVESGPVLGPDVGKAQGIDSRPVLDLHGSLPPPRRGSRVHETSGPPAGQGAPDLSQRLPGALEGEASGEPRPRRGGGGKGRRRQEDRGEDDHDGNEAAMRAGHRGLSFSQRRPTVAAEMAGAAPPRTKGAQQGGSKCLNDGCYIHRIRECSPPLDNLRLSYAGEETTP